MTASRLFTYVGTAAASAATHAIIPVFFLEDLIADSDACLLVATYLEMQTQAEIGQIFQDAKLQANANKACTVMTELTSNLISAAQDEKDTEYKVVSQLKRNHELTLAKCTIPLSVGIRKMTPLQKAFYSLDWHLWRRIIKSMKQEDIRQQLQEHVDHPGARHVDLIPYIAANLEVFDLVGRCKFNRANHYAITKTGLAQKNLFREAANYKHQYCHPVRALHPRPNFAAEENFPRRQIAYSMENRKKCEADTFEHLLGTKLMMTRGTKVDGATAWIEDVITAHKSTQGNDLDALIAYTNQGIKFANQLLTEHGVRFRPAAEINQDDVDRPEPSFWSRCFR